MCYIFTIVGKYFFLSKSCSLQHKIYTHNMCMISCINVTIATESPLGPKNLYQICSYNVASHILYFYIYSTVHQLKLKKINIFKNRRQLHYHSLNVWWKLSWNTGYIFLCTLQFQNSFF